MEPVFGFHHGSPIMDPNLIKRLDLDWKHIYTSHLQTSLTVKQCPSSFVLHLRNTQKISRNTLLWFVIRQTSCLRQLLKEYHTDFQLLYCACSETEKCLYLVKYWIRVYSSYTFLDPLEKSFRMISVLSKSRNDSWGCSLVSHYQFSNPKQVLLL